VGITEENAANVKVYPNPFTDVITVDLEESNAQYIITDISGRRVKEGMLNQRQLSLNELSTGTYTLQVYTSLSNFALKIVKQ
jgi:beta-galactosidase